MHGENLKLGNLSREGYMRSM